MNTLKSYGPKVDRKYMEIYGKSTDVKPKVKFKGKLIGNASLYYEMDTQKAFLYDEEIHDWLPQ